MTDGVLQPARESSKPRKKKDHKHTKENTTPKEPPKLLPSL